ncbi:hypothetical protein, conserved [Angomonas deanei]|uniref:Uncharacterized protein n=1 Tax=Angomonas deanei TaxID=59799 RepID=A0A7G2CJY8_9TRYP|nr:hypothetical protein, conserved [Angomonas deanei]
MEEPLERRLSRIRQKESWIGQLQGYSRTCDTALEAREVPTVVTVTGALLKEQPSREEEILSVLTTCLSRRAAQGGVTEWSVSLACLRGVGLEMGEPVQWCVRTCVLDYWGLVLKSCTEFLHQPNPTLPAVVRVIQEILRTPLPYLQSLERTAAEDTIHDLYELLLLRLLELLSARLLHVLTASLGALVAGDLPTESFRATAQECLECVEGVFWQYRSPALLASLIGSTMERLFEPLLVRLLDGQDSAPLSRLKVGLECVERACGPSVSLNGQTFTTIRGL